MKKFIQKLVHFFIEKLIKTNRFYKINKLVDQNLLVVGAHTYGIYNLLIDVYEASEAKVIIGKYCSLAPDIRIITGGNHPIDWVSTFPFRANWNLSGRLTDGIPFSKGNIIIDNDVWIGTGVTILSGVHIGDGAVIAAASVVTKDVPPYSVVGGNPAKIIKYRFTNEKITELLQLKWWEWNEERIKDKISFLNGKF